jgi:predicted flavoprotein YhiN
MPNQFCIGEMLDWDAPTGGYLSIAGCAKLVCFSKLFE